MVLRLITYRRRSATCRASSPVILSSAVGFVSGPCHGLLGLLFGALGLAAALRLAGAKARWPVMAWPTIRVFTSLVPS